MEADEFVVAVAKLAPPESTLRRAGLSPSQARAVQRSFICHRRLRPVEVVLSGPMGDLLAKYDMSDLEIGTVTLGPGVEARESGWIIGRDEADLLMLSRETGEIFVAECGLESHAIARCAKDADGFLAAILTVADYLGRSSIDRSVAENSTEKERVSLACAQKAGGLEYFPFYREIAHRVR